MVDRTVNREYPYPECQPPLVKDRSDIMFMRDLAVAINSDVQGLADRIVQLIEKPDAACVSFTGNITVSSTVTNGFISEIPYNTTVFDSNGLAALADDGLRIVERGWYMFTSMVRHTDGGSQNLMVRHARNGKTYQEGRRLDGPSSPIPGNQEAMSTTDTLLCEVGDLVQTQFYTNGVDGTYNFDARLVGAQLYRLDF